MSANVATAGMRVFRFPSTVIARFFAKRHLRATIIWGIVFGIYSASSALGFATAYQTAASRAGLAETFGSNAGLKILLGEPYRIAQVGGFTAWRALGVVTIVGAIWGLLMVTRSLRGEEETGRWELLLSGHTTARRATLNVLMGLAAALFVGYLLTTTILIAIGQSHDVQFSAQAAAFFGLALFASTLMFGSIGAAMSQLMPTRSRAASATAIIFGVAFLLRAAGAITPGWSWLMSVSPVGWVDKLHPLTDSRPLWLIPIVGVIVVCVSLALWLAGKRDLGASVFADKDEAQPRLRFLSKPLWISARLTRASSLSWIGLMAFMSLFFGTMTKAAADAFSSSAEVQKIFNNLASASAQQTGAETFMGMLFFILMTMLMMYVAGAITAVRNDEAQGYLDNILVRPVGRLQWLWGRIAIIVGVVITAGMLGALATWLGAASQHSGVPFGKLVAAGVNSLAPAMLALGVGVAALGFAPRIAGMAIYVVVSWSFLIQMVGSIVKVNHYIMDTSVFYHVALVPAADPKWLVAGIMCAIGAIAALLGALRFRNRDLETE